MEAIVATGKDRSQRSSGGEEEEEEQEQGGGGEMDTQGGEEKRRRKRKASVSFVESSKQEMPQKRRVTSSSPVSEKTRILPRSPTPSSAASPMAQSYRKVKPSEATYESFALENPFMQVVHHDGARFRGNKAYKFSSGQISQEALRTFFLWGPGRAIRRSLETFRRTSGAEMKYRIALAQLFPHFHMLASKRSRMIVASDAEEETPHIVGVSSQEESSQIPLDQRMFHEYGENLGKAHVDFAGQVLPKKVVLKAMNDGSLFGLHEEEVIENMNVNDKAWKTVTLIDAKGADLAKKWLTNYAFQLGTYGAPIATENIENGYVRPIYLIAISDDQWKLALMDAIGVLEVQQNAFTTKSMDGFLKNQRERLAWLQKKNAPSSFPQNEFREESLKRHLSTTVGKWRASNFSGVPDGKYVVGYFYIDSSVNHWDGNIEMLKKVEEPLMRGTLNLMEGLLRLLVGEKIQGYSKELIKQHLQEKEEEEKQWCEMRDK